MHATVFPDPVTLGRALAERIASQIAAARRDGRPYVLGCPGGRTPVTTYAALAELVAGSDLDHVVIAMMDEYVLDAPRRLVDADAPYSCRRFGREHIAGPLGIPDDRYLVPELDTDYDDRLERLGGVDLFLLASGASDGHIGFNPQGSPSDSTTRVVALAEATRQDNLGTFPVLGSIENVPRYGITVGIDTIRQLSRSAVMVVHGAHKAEAATRLREAEAYDPKWPATVVADCQEAELFIDQAATR